MVGSIIQWLLLSLILVALVRGQTGWQKWLRRGAGLMATLILLFMTPIVLHRGISVWEQADWNQTCTKQINTIVVLPGGVAHNANTIGQVGWGALTSRTIRRLESAIDQLVTTRAQLILIPGNADETRIMGSLAAEAGLADEQILTDSSSLNTWLASRWVAQQSRDRELGNILLVTSAIHMRRAFWSFEQQGLTVCPHPVDYQHLRPRFYQLIPKASDTYKADLLLHEVLGSLWYRLKY